MVVTNIVCAVVAVVVLGGDGAGGRARGVDHFTSSQQSPRCSSSPSCLPHDLEMNPPRQFLRWAEDRGVAAAGCWSGHWSGAGHCCSQRGHELQNQGQHRPQNICHNWLKPLQFSVNQASFAKAKSLTCMT